MEVFKMLPEGTLAEIINNQIFMSPSPLSKHQKVLNKVNNKLYNFLESTAAGEVFIAPLDVYLDENNVVQPDIIVVIKDNLRIVQENGHILGTPDLLIEVLSPENRDHDLITKKNLYEQFDVKEYWVIDPDTRETLGHKLVNGKYQSLGEEIGKIDTGLLKTSLEF